MKEQTAVQHDVGYKDLKATHRLHETDNLPPTAVKSSSDLIVEGNCIILNSLYSA